MISKMAVVDTTTIGSGTKIGEFAIVRMGVRLGKNVIIHPHVVIEPGVVVGDGVEILPGAYIGREPKGVGATARLPEFERYVSIGSECSIGSNAVIYYDVRIGRNTLIGDNASVRENVTIGERCILGRAATVNYHAQIGDRTKIMDLTHITGNCIVGNDVFISVCVGTTNDNAIGKLAYDDSRVQGPRIGDKAAIGAGANLLPNVEIGEGAVVGASALVTKNVLERKLVMGVPAKVVRDVE
jgi:acetyltransferase-like isoleucine patch superfamily enzyme